MCAVPEVIKVVDQFLIILSGPQVLFIWYSALHCSALHWHFVLFFLSSSTSRAPNHRELLGSGRTQCHWEICTRTLVSRHKEASGPAFQCPPLSTSVAGRRRKKRMKRIRRFTAALLQNRAPGVVVEVPYDISVYILLSSMNIVALDDLHGEFSMDL